MNNFAVTYIYFVSLLTIGLAFYLTGILWFRKFALSIIISSVTTVPQAILGSGFFIDYWQNPRITMGSASLEDFLFCFIAGGEAWISVLMVLRNRISLEINLRKFSARTLLILSCGIGSM